jgi:hypothetical protein
MLFSAPQVVHIVLPLLDREMLTKVMAMLLNAISTIFQLYLGG